MSNVELVTVTPQVVVVVVNVVGVQPAGSLPERSTSAITVARPPSVQPAIPPPVIMPPVIPPPAITPPAMSERDYASKMTLQYTKLNCFQKLALVFTGERIRCPDCDGSGRKGCGDTDCDCPWGEHPCDLCDSSCGFYYHIV